MSRPAATSPHRPTPIRKQRRPSNSSRIGMKHHPLGPGYPPASPTGTPPAATTTSSVSSVSSNSSIDHLDQSVSTDAINAISAISHRDHGEAGDSPPLSPSRSHIPLLASSSLGSSFIGSSTTTGNSFSRSHCQCSTVSISPSSCACSRIPQAVSDRLSENSARSDTSESSDGAVSDNSFRTHTPHSVSVWKRTPNSRRRSSFLAGCMLKERAFSRPTGFDSDGYETFSLQLTESQGFRWNHTLYDLDPGDDVAFEDVFEYSL